MMTYPRNIWDSKADWLVIPSNTQGIAGAGLALQAAERYPDQAQEYKRACRRGVHEVGYPVITPIDDPESPHKALYWFASKTVVQQPSRLSYIVTGFEKLAHQLIANPTITVALPPVGCGLGGLELHNVRQYYEKDLHPYFAGRIDLVGDWGPIDPVVYYDLRDKVYTAINENVAYDFEGYKSTCIDPYDAAIDVLDVIGREYTITKKE